MKRQISSGIVLSALSQLISIIVGLTYTPVMIRLLGQNEFGLYQLVQSVVNYLNLMNFGFNGAYIRFYSIAKSKNETAVANINGMFFSIFSVLALLCITLGTVLFFNLERLLGAKITADEYIIAHRLLIIMVLNLAISFPMSLFVAYINANERFVFSKSLGIVMNVIAPILNIPILLLGYGSIGIVSASLLIHILRFVINMGYCLKYLGMKITLGYFDYKIFKELFNFTFFIFLSDLVDQLNSNVDKYLLGRMLGTISVALYSVGANLKAYYTIISWIIPEMFIPQVTRIAIEENNNVKLSRVFTNVGRYNNYILLLVFSGFFLLGKEFIYLWVGEQYEKSYYVTLILMAAGYIASVQTLGVNIQNAKNMHQVRSVIFFAVAVLNVISSIYFIELWGVIGTCIGTLIALLVGTGFIMNWYYKNYIKLDIAYFWREILRWTIPVTILVLICKIGMRMVSINNWFSLVCVIILYSLFYVILLWKIEIKEEEKQKITSKVRFLIGRRG